MATCQYVLASGHMVLNADEWCKLRCAADAVEGSAYCPVHDAMARGITWDPVRRIRRRHREHDRDILPWGDDDAIAFQTPWKRKY